MTWAKLDDGLDEHPKVDALLEADELEGLAAVGLWVLTLTNSARRELDGRVTPRTVRRIAPENGERLTSRLLEAGLYDPASDHVVLHDFLEYNPSHADLVEKRRKDSERKAKRIPSGIHTEGARNPDGIQAEAEANPPGLRSDSNAPVPVPVPVPVEKTDVFSSEIIRLCDLLAELILGNAPKAKTAPGSERWRNDMRLLVERDGHEPVFVEKVIRWAAGDPFWRSNILSPGKLREKFDQLTLRMKAAPIAAVVNGNRDRDQIEPWRDWADKHLPDLDREEVAMVAWQCKAGAIEPDQNIEKIRTEVVARIAA